MNRIHRGFHRIGLVLAGLALLFAAFVAVASTEKTFALFMVAFAVFLYVAARAVGWVLNGFMGPSARM